MTEPAGHRPTRALVLLECLLGRLHGIAQLVVLVGLLHLAIHLHHMLVPLLQGRAQLALATLNGVTILQ